MTSDETAALMDFLATRFARMDAAFAAIDARFAEIDARFTGIEARLTAIEARLTRIEARQDAMETRQDVMETRLTRVAVLQEEMRDDVRRLAEGLASLNERFDREFGGLKVRFDRFEVDFGTVQLDHGMRITALEQHRKRGGPRG
jgi:chromosome segregation ATPase